MSGAVSMPHGTAPANRAQRMRYEGYNRRDQWKGTGLSIALHALLFFLGGLLWVHPVTYGVTTGETAVEVELVAAPAPPPQVVQKAHEPEPVMEKVPEEKVQIQEVAPPPPVAAPKPQVVSEGNAPVPGLNSVTQRASAGAQIAARPNYLRNPAPRYPEASRRNGEEGVVLLSAHVDRSGKPLQVNLSRSSGFERLDRAAIESVKRWVFEPAKIGPLSVESTVQIPVRFRLDDRS